MSARRPAAWPSVAAIAVVLGLLLASVPLLVTASPAQAAAKGNDDGGPWSATKELVRTFAKADGSTAEVDRRQVTVSVDKTQQLQGRERVQVSWSGAHPSSGRAANPFGESGLNQEYPVVLLQCRGLDDPSLPAAQQLSPETCWTSTRQQRSQRVSPDDAVWARDLDASAADRRVKSGLPDYPAETCGDTDPGSYAHVTPFRAVGDKLFLGCTGETMPPEAAVGASFPPAEQAAFAKSDGAGSTSFEVRSSIENESLGCSATVRCSLVVVPVMGLSCVAPDPAFAIADRNCRRAGTLLPGSNNFANDGIDATVGPALWWSASNWKNRFSVPLTFALAPNACELLDQREPVPFYGSELLSQAAAQWAPAYCLRKDRFKWQQNGMPDDAAFTLMQEGRAAAATVSGLREDDSDVPVGYAPTAVTGFAVSYVADLPDNAGEVPSLKLDARLLAKLLTQSYTASGLGEQHPGMEKNPRSITVDPEFVALNPGLPQQASEAAATVMSLSTSSDVISTITDYIATDPEAKAFVEGKADQWGMVVNPSYKGYDLPTPKWELRDTFVPESALECLQQNKGPYLSRVAAPVSTLRQIASAVLDAWPLVATKCDRATATDPWKLGRIDRQGMGGRFLIGITTLGDARRLGLHTAALQTAPGTYTAPTDAALAAALATATPSKNGLEPFTMSQRTLRRTPAAYPGTMVVYTAAALSDVDKARAADVAQFIRVSTTEGQVRGRGNGRLPEGYLPITGAGPTKPLLKQADRVAELVAAQKKGKGNGGGDGAAAGGSGAAGGPGISSGGAGGVAGLPTADLPGGADPTTAGSAGATGADAAAEAAPATETARTVAASARVGGVLVPVLVALVLTAAGLQLVARAARRPRRTKGAGA